MAIYITVTDSNGDTLYLNMETPIILRAANHPQYDGDTTKTLILFLGEKYIRLQESVDKVYNLYDQQMQFQKSRY